jgi:hypothetical protein
MSLARNAVFNLAGHLAPLAAAVLALPLLASRLDPERFGFLALAWVISACSTSAWAVRSLASSQSASALPGKTSFRP